MSNLLPILAIAGMLLAGSVHSASDVPADHFQITDRILQKDPPNFSTNLKFPGFAPWFADVRVNRWNVPWTAGPIQFQHQGRIDAGGADWFQQISSPRLSWWDSARSGFWDGATVYIYRIENGEMHLLRTSKVARSETGRDPKTNAQSEEKIWLTEEGEPIRGGDFFVLRMETDRMPGQFRPELIAPSKVPVMNGYCTLTGEADWSYDKKNPAPEGDSRASLRIDVKEASEKNPAGPWHWFIVEHEREGVVRFNPGKSYKAQVWLKQQDMSDPRVQIQFGTIKTGVVEVTPEWQKFEFEIPWEDPQNPYATSQSDGTRMWIGALSPGTLWIDNFIIWQTDVPQNAIMPREVEILREFQPHVLRLWGGLDAPSLDYWLRGGFAQTVRGGYGKTENPVFASLGQALEVCEQTGADPWLILNPWFTAEENAGLMEYLAGPADKGYGKLRAEQGRTAPWTEAFETIYLESANEAWNQIMRYALPGQPETYAVVADRQFREFKASPFYQAGKFEMIANGWDNSMSLDGWSRRVALASKEADRVDLAYYFGGWEQGASTLASESEVHAGVYQDKLFGTAIEHAPKILDAATFDPALLQRFAKILQEEPDLLAAGLAALPDSRIDFAAEQLVAPDGDIEVLWQTDVDFPSSVRGLLAHRRTALELPFWEAAYRAMVTEPSLQPAALQALALPDDELLPSLSAALVDNNAPRLVEPILKKNPELATRWLALEGMPPRAISELEAFQQSGSPITYDVTNELNKRLRDVILQTIRSGNEAFLSAIVRETSPESLQAKMRHHYNHAFNSTLREPPNRRVQQLMKAMVANPPFAEAALSVIASKPEIFQRQSESIAQNFSEQIVALYGRGEAHNPEAEARLLLPNLPEATRRELLTRLQEATNSSADLTPDAAILLNAIVSASLGDSEAASALAKDAGFQATLQNRITEAIPAPFLAAARQDARIGDRLSQRFALNPSLEAKGLANYEGGPGYSLPGPGKAPPEEDENIGKSLALGTATLDTAMEFLAAGSSPIAYYDYKTGPYWASHNNPVERIPYPSWLALKMRNTLCPGDLLLVEPLAVKRVDVPDKKIIKTTNDGRGREVTVKGRDGIALTTCHAFRDGDQLSILLLNRSFSEPRKVVLDLPANLGGPSRQYTLTHEDPTAHNRTRAEVQIQESEGPELKSGVEITVPPASVIILQQTRAHLSDFSGRNTHCMERNSQWVLCVVRSRREKRPELPLSFGAGFVLQTGVHSRQASLPGPKAAASRPQYKQRYVVRSRSEERAELPLSLWTTVPNSMKTCKPQKCA